MKSIACHSWESAVELHAVVLVLLTVPRWATCTWSCTCSFLDHQSDNRRGPSVWKEEEERGVQGYKWTCNFFLFFFNPILALTFNWKRCCASAQPHRAPRMALCLCCNWITWEKSICRWKTEWKSKEKSVIKQLLLFPASKIKASILIYHYELEL